MTLTEREKFIHHFVTLTTVKVIHEHMGEVTEENLALFDMKRIVKIIRDTRCRKMTEDDIEILLDQLSEEALVGGSIINDLIKN
tara:strand:+ start:2097 stop:2348 length:252 start_codon:yes stop_codon:yes gene_type:complete